MSLLYNYENLLSRFWGEIKGDGAAANFARAQNLQRPFLRQQKSRPRKAMLCAAAPPHI